MQATACLRSRVFAFFFILKNIVQDTLRKAFCDIEAKGILNDLFF